MLFNICSQSPAAFGFVERQWSTVNFDHFEPVRLCVARVARLFVCLCCERLVSTELTRFGFFFR